MMGLFSFGNVLSLLFGGNLVDGIGRKNTLIIMSIINGIAFIFLAFATNIILILIARTMNGICLGGFMVSLPIFISEITEDHNRGKFGVFMGLFTPVGQLYCYTMGFIFSYKFFSLTCVIPIFVGVALLLFFVPETPIHLLHKNNKCVALESLKKYRSNLTTEELEKNIQLMECSMKKSAKDGDGNWKSIFSHQPTRRGLIIGLGMFMLQNGSGIGVLMSFMGPIFEEAEVSISGNVIAILVGILKIFTYFLVANVVEKSGRRLLIFVSAIMSSIALFILGAYFFLKENNFGSTQKFSWLPVASILFFIFSYAIGLGPVPNATIGELFPVNIRATAFSIITLFSTIFNSILSSTFPLLVSYIHISACMWIFSGFCILGAAFVFFLMPETKGKSIDAIQEMLKDHRLF